MPEPNSFSLKDMSPEDVWAKNWGIYKGPSRSYQAGRRKSVALDKTESKREVRQSN